MPTFETVNYNSSNGPLWNGAGQQGAAIAHAVKLFSSARKHNALTWANENALEEFHKLLSLENGVESRSMPLLGVPIVVKDNIDVRGIATTAATLGLRDAIASDDAPVVRYLREAGAVVVAKSNMHELALGATSINPAFGTVVNPHDTRYSAGGSSGGSAVAVALGMVQIALGTDTSGSSRVPASCCGIVGFRPSFDRYPIDRVVPISYNRDTVGLLGSTVDHIAAVDRILAPMRWKEAKRPGRLRLGIPSRLAWQAAKRVRDVFQAAVERLVRDKVEVVECDIPDVPKQLWSTQVSITGFDMPRHLEVYLRRCEIDIALEDLLSQISDQTVKKRIKEGLDDRDAAKKHEAAMRTTLRMRASVQALFAELRLDGLFYPTMPTTAARVDEVETIQVDDRIQPTGPTLLRNTLLATLIGLPSISLPIGVASDGIPVGALLEALPGEDAALLANAKRLETALRA
ncbi:amidase family protein [Bradyrhizobium manausense]